MDFGRSNHVPTASSSSEPLADTIHKSWHLFPASDIISKSFSVKLLLTDWHGLENTNDLSSPVREICFNPPSGFPAEEEQPPSVLPTSDLLPVQLCDIFSGRSRDLSLLSHCTPCFHITALVKMFNYIFILSFLIACFHNEVICFLWDKGSCLFCLIDHLSSKLLVI